MTWQDATDIAVAKTSDERFRVLCSDDNPDAGQREAFRATVLAIAGGRPAEQGPSVEPKAVPIVQADPWLKLIRDCPDFQPGCCASPAPFCTRYLLSPTREMCIECLGGNS
jgi:hypothetical protein